MKTLSMFGLLALAATFASQNAMAAPAPEFCTTRPTTPDLIATLPTTPSYFAKITPDGKQMGFIMDSGNFITDLTPERATLKVPGPYDPVPTPDGAWIMIPIGGTISFFSLEGLNQFRSSNQMADLTDVQPKFANTGLSGNYQSAGILAPTADRTAGIRYRVMISGDQYRDFQFKDGALSAIGDVKALCTNLGSSLRLPMISKDGLMVSGFFPDTDTTRLYRINGSNCDMLLDLGVATGKVEFNYTNDMITFHADSYADDDEGSFFSGVRTSLSKNVYVAKLDTSKPKQLSVLWVQRVTNNTKLGSGSYYPSFTLDNRVAYLNGEDGKYDIRIVNPAGTEPARYILANQKLSPSAYALGALWNRSCRPDQTPGMRLTPVDQALTSLSLSSKSCQALVQAQWTNLKDDVVTNMKVDAESGLTKAALSALTANDLLAACPKALKTALTVTTVTQSVAVTATQPTAPIPGNIVFQNRCLGCHDSTNGAAPNIDWNKLDRETIDEMIRRVQSRDSTEHMPPNIPLNAEFEMKPLIETLTQKKQTLQTPAH